MPYLEGELDEAKSAEMAARLVADPALAEEAERLRRTLGHLRRSASRAPTAANSAVPADLWPRLRARLEPAPPPRRPAQIWWMAGVGATAALAFAALWLPMHAPVLPAHSPAPKPPLIASQTAPRPISPAASPRPAAGPSAAKVETGQLTIIRPEKVAVPVPPRAASYSNPFAGPSAPTATEIQSGGPTRRSRPAANGSRRNHAPARACG